MENNGLFVCLRNIFFILIFVFGCQESAEKMPRNTSPMVILLREKGNFPSFNPRLLVAEKVLRKCLETLLQQSYC